MRVITGTARGVPLKAPKGMDTRPTMDQVKEGIFSAIQFEVEGRRALDLFAGSGQLGIEALSRGAKRAVFVDSAKASCGVVLENIHTTGFENEAQVMNAEYASYLLRCTETFDIAFLDPPYRTGTLTKALLAVTPHMNRGGIVICEHPTDEDLPETAGEFVRVRDYRYGKILLTAYRHQSMV